jgi:hypothetical protein
MGYILCIYILWFFLVFFFFFFELRFNFHWTRPDFFCFTLAAERQVRDFLIGPRNKKQRKKRSTIKILHPPFQITSRDF